MRETNKVKKALRSARQMSGVDISGAMVEAVLELLIAQHGFERVRRQLEKLVGRSNWSDYQRVSALARNVANRIKRNQ